jgi:hypothetical protein
MAEFTVDLPAPVTGPFVAEEDAAAWLKVSAKTLQRMARKIPWLTRYGHGKGATYATRRIAILAVLMEENGLPAEIFSRSPSRTQPDPAGPSRTTKPGREKPQDQDS